MIILFLDLNIHITLYLNRIFTQTDKNILKIIVYVYNFVLLAAVNFVLKNQFLQFSSKKKRKINFLESDFIIKFYLFFYERNHSTMSSNQYKITIQSVKL